MELVHISAQGSLVLALG
jgi:hypothetical protein